MAACSLTYSHNLTFFIFISHHLEDLQSLNTYSTTIWIIKCLLHHDISERIARQIQHSLRLLTNTAILRVTSALRFYTEICNNMWKKLVFPVAIYGCMQKCWRRNCMTAELSHMARHRTTSHRHLSIIRYKHYAVMSLFYNSFMWPEYSIKYPWHAQVLILQLITLLCEHTYGLATWD